MSKELQQYDYCMEVVELKKNIELAFLVLGEKLHTIKEQELFYSNWESFNDYLEEIKISPSVASRLITVYTKMVLEYNLSNELIANAGGWSNAYEIIKITNSKEEAEEWLKDSENRMSKDTKIALREAKYGVKQEDCDHDYYQLRICRKCNDKQMIYEENSSEI